MSFLHLWTADPACCLRSQGLESLYHHLMQSAHPRDHTPVESEHGLKNEQKSSSPAAAIWKRMVVRLRWAQRSE